MLLSYEMSPLAPQAERKTKKTRINQFKYVCVHCLMNQQYVCDFSLSLFTICRSSIRAFTPASISFRSWGVSGHGYKVALNLKADDKLRLKTIGQNHFINYTNFYRFAYPSQIFLTLFFNWSPWKKMMKTDLWTWSL